MRLRLLIAVVIAGLAASAADSLAQPTISSDFEASLDGWNAVGFDIAFGFPPPVTRVPNPADMVHGHTGGNPGGYAQLTDAVSDPGSFASAPAKFLGNLSAYKDVGTLSFDHRLFQTGVNSGISQYIAFIVSGDPNNYNFMSWQSPGPAAATGWVHFDIPINAATWTRFPLATMTFDQILANVTEILLPFELVDNDGAQNQEHAGIDNVVLAALAGDYNGNGRVDAADYVVWRNGPSPQAAGYNLWRANFGRTAGSGAGDFSEPPLAVPEPTTAAFWGLFLTLAFGLRRIRCANFARSSCEFRSK